MKCCFKGCDEQGEPSEGFDFFACEECCEDLEKMIAALYAKEREELYAKHAKN